MSVKTLIQDGTGTSRQVCVTSDHALMVTSLPISITNLIEIDRLDVLTRVRLYNALMKNSSDSPDMNVDGSITPVEFDISADADILKSLCAVRFVFNSTQMALGAAEGTRFAAAAASPGLTNGIRFYVEQSGHTTEIFHTPVKQIVNFLHYTDDYINEPGALGAGTDLLTVQVRFELPIHIVPGAVDRLVVKIQDDLTDIDFFNVTVLGTQEDI